MRLLAELTIPTGHNTGRVSVPATARARTYP